MKADELIAYHPQVFHTADARAWASIQSRGLLPAKDLLVDAVGGSGSGPGERRLRSQVLTTEGADGHVVVIRDQKPLKFLDDVLEEGTTREEFLHLLDSRVFFWATAERLGRLLRGRMYRTTPQVVLTVDTRSLVEAYGEVIEVSPYNTGSAHVPSAPRRGKSVSQRLDDFEYDAWRAKRRKADAAVVEATIPGAVPDILDHVVRVDDFPGPHFPTSSTEPQLDTVASDTP
ncbi:hypothetical protein MM440_06185 [Arsenicicoccus piscis]|uniref:Uncharacterized protein n=1 Tax=Arsenicicoccus piscis TaxID=673954 RepID=A0ABQ6HT34_9MICO|nr:hypothetical protein [Arsenicicoccus piscis]MCH8627380.1 hypothetical protein [Arsenicicoccus piscis]GMA21537.1 hypothetical protein GCM10025862_35580 [Arsenicicoccus piscis]GMA22143.1 hypothetical protein GCM10025862_41660 [Arsenicicoccus piscis]